MFVDEEIQKSIGKVVVAPEVIATIAHSTSLSVPGVIKFGTPPSTLFRRATTKRDGIVLHDEDGHLTFDIYLLLQSGVNMVETSRSVQTSVMEAIDQMIGSPIKAINVHISNVIEQE